MRPSKALEAKPKILEYLRTGGSFRAACGHAGICEATGYEYRSSDPEFSEAVEKAKSCGEAKLVSDVVQTAHDRKHPGQLTACMFLLNTVHGYSRKNEIARKGEAGGESKSYRDFIKIIDASSDEEREAFAAAVERMERNGGRRGC